MESSSTCSAVQTSGVHVCTTTNLRGGFFIGPVAAMEERSGRCVLIDHDGVVRMELGEQTMARLPFGNWHEEYQQFKTELTGVTISEALDVVRCWAKPVKWCGI